MWGISRVQYDIGITIVPNLLAFFSSCYSCTKYNILVQYWICDRYTLVHSFPASIRNNVELVVVHVFQNLAASRRETHVAALLAHTFVFHGYHAEYAIRLLYKLVFTRISWIHTFLTLAYSIYVDLSHGLAYFDVVLKIILSGFFL